jgi:hypothetical protein
MTQFDFQRPHDTEVRNWLYPRIGAMDPLIDIDAVKGLDEGITSAHKKYAWADENDVPLQNIARFLPPLPLSDQNRKSWTDSFCDPRTSPLLKLSAQEKQFFSPALKSFECASLKEKRSQVPVYLNDFYSSDKSKSSFISLWFPSNAADSAKVKAAFPESLSLREVADLFPRTLSKEMRWMIPLSVLLASLFLFYYYRRLSLTLLALLPFFCAVGTYAVAAKLFSMNFSFISLIGMLMIFAFSLDYGVFAVDVTVEPEGRSINGVWTCLLLSGISTILGFLPLMGCEHPVLVHLGQTLTLGTLGTVIGTLWGIPGVVKLTKVRV